MAAANRLSIETFDMQHGAQTKTHLAYGSWSTVPIMGYDFLPRTYLCWDNHSEKAVLEWGAKNKLFKVLVTGNSWVDYWRNKPSTYNENGFILYTLQPEILSLEQSFPIELVEIIKSLNYKWFVRLHPRQIKQKNEIQEFLKNKGILAQVNIDGATNTPLPLLLRNCLLHITNSSTCTIEASFFQKKTIIINEIGKLYYSELISEGKAVYIEMNGDFKKNFEKYIYQIKQIDSTAIVDENTNSSKINTIVTSLFS
ncbi:MAG: hypothetical protein IPG89_18555 [Bacteroidetes bacterium]|nr:hypothetical protein [Bacteroidota bacterium]